MTGGRLSWGRAKQHRAEEMFLELSLWLLRKLFLFCVFKVSFLARLASRHLLADTPSFSTCLLLCNPCLVSSEKKKKDGKENIQQNVLSFLRHVFFLIGMWSLCRGSLLPRQWDPSIVARLFIWPLCNPSSTMLCIILRDKLIATYSMGDDCGH